MTRPRSAIPPIIVLVGLTCACAGHDDGATASAWFVDRAEASGLIFTHRTGTSGRFYQPEVMAPGVGLLDYDNDGDLDAYLVQSGTLDGPGPTTAVDESQPVGDRLYRNDLAVREDGSRVLRFTDVTVHSGIQPRGYGMGIAAGDIDNDGDVDIYLTGFGRNQMFRNDGGRFADVSAASGTDAPSAWGVSAGFLDFDRDGWLDLFVGNYLNYSVASHVRCASAGGVPDYCRPSAYRAEPSRLYRNTGRGRFADVTAKAGLAREVGPALGVSTADFNGDGWIDLFVANDEQENQLWINQRDGTFVNTAPIAGAALGPYGERKANMGVDAGDFDGDGDEDVIITELVSQGSTLYVNDGSGLFEERSVQTGLRRASLPYTGFGTAWFDYDNDGRLDVLAVNGHVNRDAVDAARQRDPFPMGQRKLLLKNAGGTFENVTAQAGAAFDRLEAGRGAAFGDVDNDGDIDVLVGNGEGPVELLINEAGARQRFVGLRLIDASGRDALGARVRVTAGGRQLWRRARADGSYASANDPRVLAGLGTFAGKVDVRIGWPSGRVEEWTGLDAQRYVPLREGTGAAVRDFLQ